MVRIGGSGGFGRKLHDDELKALEQAAKEAIKEGAQPERRNVFLSFAFEDLNEVNLLRGQAKNEESDLDFVDRSLHEPFDSKNAEYIRRGIRERIKQSSVTVCYLSNNTAQSKWVDWEIRESLRLGKGVIAVHKGDKPPSSLPSAIKEHNIKITGWKHGSLSKEIDRAAKER